MAAIQPAPVVSQEIQNKVIEYVEKIVRDILAKVFLIFTNILALIKDYIDWSNLYL